MVFIQIVALTLFFITKSKWWLYVTMIAFILWMEKTK